MEERQMNYDLLFRFHARIVSIANGTQRRRVFRRTSDTIFPATVSIQEVSLVLGRTNSISLDPQQHAVGPGIHHLSSELCGLNVIIGAFIIGT
jgi:hypothetical protein